MKFTVAVSAFLLASSAQAASFRRRLSFERIAGYEPRSQVTDHNAIDLDQQAIEIQLAMGTTESFNAASKIYTDGAFSKSVAKVQLASPLTSSVAEGDQITGLNADGAEVVGTAYASYSTGADVIEIQYRTLDLQSSYVGCQVGANPNPNTVGCFAPTGTLSINGEGSVSYTYNPLTDNGNKRTIQGFSTAAKEKMHDCPNCPYSTYKKFYDYYGAFDYANQWVLAAFDGSRTSFSNGNADFGIYGFEGKGEAIKKGTAFMNIWMYVIREMEDALDDCQEGCSIENCNDDPVHAWDEAVAFYTGSLEGKDGSGSGVLLHALADKRCENFKTCGDLANDVTGTSHVNLEIFRQFSIGLNKLLQAQCSSAREQKERIEQLMAVPMIQGALRYAYIIDMENNSGEKAEAEGATFAAAVLPLVHACNADAAATIYDSLRVGNNGSANFQKVKSAFESVYECMGIRAEYVGGYYDMTTGQYFKGAAPAGVSSNSGPNVGLIVGLTVGGFVFLLLVYVLSVRRGKRAAADVQNKLEQSEVAQEQPEQPSVEASEVM
ncbi:low iron-inducible periplasmic protein [Nitzschia inconspicua]|uniref:Low iron-inducible periplasmic protein n=1 Tax=Nitzschia inconspicua TaxID=303405 RepID=A0A9K3KG68_9STRA|nr:low iron-inducible periplasmic protein [Nitzschia inconspicua]